MSRVLDAEVKSDKKVYYDGKEVKDALILSEGNKESQGVLIISEGLVKYLTSNATDIKETLEKVSEALLELSTALTTLDAKPTGGTGSASVPTVVASVTKLNQLKAQLDTLKDTLK